MTIQESPTPQRPYLLSLWKGRLDAPGCLSPMATIAGEIAARHGYTLSDLKGRSLLQPVVLARQEAMYWLYEERLSDGRRRWSYPMIGRFLGGRDHTTVWFGARAHAARVAQ